MYNKRIFWGELHLKTDWMCEDDKTTTTASGYCIELNIVVLSCFILAQIEVYIVEGLTKDNCCDYRGIFKKNDD
ncbi:hypothetical protein WA026_006206 [Henosepilachna vigintioctopunctata]|uniref:Uncharacterized protein n=1 Tax=Henosepilachna vigintioctopunctata TaxID=420089 RepID=A0AAW1TI10_9CUCU